VVVAVFGAIFVLKRSVYQDRLGRSTGKFEKNTGVFCRAPTAAPTLRWTCRRMAWRY
jgi:hypothetical protein